jgi:uncharacterized damage-inducible protein DinB
MNVREFLMSPIAYLAPAKALEGLGAAEAERHVPGAPHSVAEIVAHMAFWQDWWYARCAGDAVPVVASAALGWPAVSADSWPGLRSRFVERLHQLALLSDGNLAAPVTPSIEFPPLAKYTIGEALVHVATHTGYHLGQVILLRQMLGAWPPPSGGWTW